MHLWLQNCRKEMVLLQDSKLIFLNFKTSLCIHVKTPRDILVSRRAVEQSCSPLLAGKSLPTFFLIILGLYYTVRYFITAKIKTLVLSPLSCSNTKQSWSASDECPSGAGSKCRFSKEHLSNINTGPVLSGLSDSSPAAEKSTQRWNPEVIFQLQDSEMYVAGVV